MQAPVRVPVPALLLACAALSGCEGAPRSPPADSPGRAVPGSVAVGSVAAGSAADGSVALAPVADPQQLMLHLIEPAAEVYWDAVGIVVDEEGEHPFAPGSDAEWEAVTNAAYLLAESGNLLMLDERARESGHWEAMARGMREVGALAAQAAAARDPDAVFEVGGDLYLVCTGCHAVYAAETLRPSYDAGLGPSSAATPGRSPDASARADTASSAASSGAAPDPR